jgi:hypothetical protein
MSESEMPGPPYVLLFEEVVPGARPLAIMVDDRAAVPLFASRASAKAFLDSTSFGVDLEPVEVSAAGLMRALESVEEAVDHVALDPPPASEGGMRVRMGSLPELIAALDESRREDNLFDLLGEDDPPPHY